MVLWYTCTSEQKSFVFQFYPVVAMNCASSLRPLSQILLLSIRSVCCLSCRIYCSLFTYFRSNPSSKCFTICKLWFQWLIMGLECSAYDKLWHAAMQSDEWKNWEKNNQVRIETGKLLFQRWDIVRLCCLQNAEWSLLLGVWLWIVWTVCPCLFLRWRDVKFLLDFNPAWSCLPDFLSSIHSPPPPKFLFVILMASAVQFWCLDARYVSDVDDQKRVVPSVLRNARRGAPKQRVERFWGAKCCEFKIRIGFEKLAVLISGYRTEVCVPVIVPAPPFPLKSSVMLWTMCCLLSCCTLPTGKSEWVLVRQARDKVGFECFYWNHTEHLELWQRNWISSWHFTEQGGHFTTYLWVFDEHVLVFFPGYSAGCEKFHWTDRYQAVRLVPDRRTCARRPSGRGARKHVLIT